MMPLLSLGFFADWDIVQWSLFIALVVAFLAYYFWPENIGKADAEVTIDSETRKKASPLIALAQQESSGQWFTLNPMPLQIRANAEIRSSGGNMDRSKVREALWSEQRAMITRLESELDYAQQADISDHFAIAAPANQPGALLQKTLKELEETRGKVRGLLKLEPSNELWHGRALILMLSNRKLFDHVAWLTGAGLAASAPGAFTQVQDDVVVITIYATRLGGFTRPLTLQVCRAAICCTGGQHTPKWLEYGLAHWVTQQLLGKARLPQGDSEPVWDTEKGVEIFDSAAWDRASEDSSRLERLVTQSALHTQQLMAAQGQDLLAALAKLSSMSEDQATASLASFTKPVAAEK